MCIRDRHGKTTLRRAGQQLRRKVDAVQHALEHDPDFRSMPVSYTHLRAHETVLDLVCRLLLEKKHIYNAAYVNHIIYIYQVLNLSYIIVLSNQ